MENGIGDYLKILEIISFDDTLFRKEFYKTLNWIPMDNYPEIEVWMRSNHYASAFPELLDYIRLFD